MPSSSPHNLPIGTTHEWRGCLLTLTEDGWRAEVKHSMHRRCKGWDYCMPWTYMVTLDTQHHDTPPVPRDIADYRLPEWLVRQLACKGHPHLFGELCPALDSEGRAHIDLNAFGKAVEESIEGISRYYPQIRIIDKVVMPNHVHIVLRVQERLPEKKPLGFVLNKWKSGVNALFKQIVLGLPKETHMHIVQQRAHPDQRSYGRMSFPSQTESTTVGRTSSRFFRGPGSSNPDTGLVFEAGFHDRILFRREQLEVLLRYVHDNPQRLWALRHNPQYFRVMVGLRITLPVLGQSGTQGAGRWWEYYPGGRQALELEGGACGLLAPLNVDIETQAMTLTINALGNRSLLQVPERMQIQCSRRMTQLDIQSLVDDVMEACRHGVVIVSPCISPGEKAVARAVMEAGFPLIVFFPQGIPPQTPEYKPYGQFFEACARGQLLILSPWAFKAGVARVTRWQCLMLNELAAQLTLNSITV